MENGVSKKSKNIVWISVLILVLLVPVLAYLWKQYKEYRVNVYLQEAVALESEKKFDQAFQKYLKASELGNKDAQFNLGFAYANGLGTEKSNEKALYWYGKSAEQGDKQAQIVMGVIYSVGRGVEKNPEKAKYWQKKAEEQSQKEAGEPPL
ncbi:MAG: sel1 repeat family protein [Oligoflexales bacterium]|nr:sel1 repeat family protein [Oligoflexales bacterium]